MMSYVEIALHVVVVGYTVAVMLGYTCLRHDWHTHGPTQHMAWDTKANKRLFWSRYWRVCSRCNAKRHGKKVSTAIGDSCSD